MDQALALSIHHVGGRGGTRRFPALQRFERDIVNVLYEADHSAIAEMQAHVATLASDQKVIEACVGLTRRQAAFYRLWNPAASSYLPISNNFRKNYAYLSEDVLDYDDKAWEVIQTIELETVSLDQLINQDAKAPPPDFLSLNTQGSELEIIQGASRLLERHVLAVQTELSFPEIYEQQAGFDDIVRVLRGAGFRLAKLFQHGTRGHGFCLNGKTTRTPIGMRGGGAVVQADAIFVKEPQHILDHHGDPGLGMTKALFFGFVFGYFDYCYACASGIPQLKTKHVRAAASRFAYIRFVQDYLQAIREYPIIFPPVWSDLFAAGSAERYDAPTVRAHYFASVSKDDFRTAVAALTNPNYFGLETVAMNYGLEEEAKALQYNRLASVWNNMRYLGLVDDKEGGALELHLERLD
jgi:FkbM family methyltransferase